MSDEEKLASLEREIEEAEEKLLHMKLQANEIRDRQRLWYIGIEYEDYGDDRWHETIYALGHRLGAEANKWRERYPDCREVSTCSSEDFDKYWILSHVEPALRELREVYAPNYKLLDRAVDVVKVLDDDIRSSLKLRDWQSVCDKRGPSALDE